MFLVKLKNELLKLNFITIDVIFILLLTVALFIFTANGFNLPFYWDSAAFLISGAKSIADTGNLLAYVEDTDYPHFFLLPWFLSLFINLPNHVVVIHFIGYLLSVFFLITMYYLGKTIVNRGIGAALALTFLTNPLFLAQTNLVYFEIIGTAFRYLAIIFLIKNRYSLFLLASLLAFVREYNALVLFFIGLVYVLLNQEIRQKREWFLKFLLPIILATVLWLISHYLAVGWWLYSPQRNYVEDHLGTLTHGLDYLLLAQGRWVLLAILIAAAAILFFATVIKKIAWTGQFAAGRVTLILLFASAVATLGRITVLGYFLQRHIFPALPVYYLLTLLLLYKILTRVRFAFWISVLLILFIQFQNRYDCRAWNLEDCTTVYQLLDSKKQATQFLEKEGRNVIIGVSGMDRWDLTNPLNGYVSDPLEVVTPPFTDLPHYLFVTPTSDALLNTNITIGNYQEIRRWSLPNAERAVSIYEKEDSP